MPELESVARLYHRIRNELSPTLNWRVQTHLGQGITPKVLLRSFPPYLSGEMPVAEALRSHAA